MDQDVRTFGDELGRRVLACEWPAVHQMLAPWLRESLTVDAVRIFFEDEYRLTLGENGITGLRYPEHPAPELDGDEAITATCLRQPIEYLGGKVRPVPPEVTDRSLRCWMNLKLTGSEEQVARLGFTEFCDLWMAVVETDEGLRVGYWSMGPF